MSFMIRSFKVFDVPVEHRRTRPKADERERHRCHHLEIGRFLDPRREKPCEAAMLAERAIKPSTPK